MPGDASASEVLRDGLRLLEEHELLRAAKLAALRQGIPLGLDSGDTGVWDVEEFKREGRKLLAERCKTAEAPF
jgi:antitoxin ParD1/3/4